MNAETTTITRAGSKGPTSALDDQPRLYFVDNSKSQKDPSGIVQFNDKQLRSYATHAPEGWNNFGTRCGRKAVPYQIIVINLQAAKPFFTGKQDIYSGKTDKTSAPGYQPTFVTVVPEAEFDALIADFKSAFDGPVVESDEPVDVYLSKHQNYKEDYKRDGKNRKLGIKLFRDLLNSEERVTKFMQLMAGVMHGGAKQNSGLWDTFRGFFQFIISGMIEDHKQRRHKRKTDGDAQLEYPHLSYPAVAKAILDAKVNLTVGNTGTQKPLPVRKGAAGSGAKPQSEQRMAREYATLSHMLKWILVLAQAENTVTVDLYVKLCDLGKNNDSFAWLAWNLGSFCALFGLYLGPTPKKPESKDTQPKKPVQKAAEAVKAEASEDEEDSEDGESEDGESDDGESDDGESEEEDGA